MRAGATLLFDSDPDEEERETRIKAAAFVDAIRRPRGGRRPMSRLRRSGQVRAGGSCSSIIRTPSCTPWPTTSGRPAPRSTTLRAGFARPRPRRARTRTWWCSRRGPDARATSTCRPPWPRPSQRRLPVFGVCLGLQGMVEYFGGELGRPRLARCTARRRRIRVRGGRIFEGLPQRVRGRPLSLALRAERDRCPPRSE